jgi:hypothetical protein
MTLNRMEVLLAKVLLRSCLTSAIWSCLVTPLSSLAATLPSFDLQCFRSYSAAFYLPDNSSSHPLIIDQGRVDVPTYHLFSVSSGYGIKIVHYPYDSELRTEERLGLTDLVREFSGSDHIFGWVRDDSMNRRAYTLNVKDGTLSVLALPNANSFTAIHQLEVFLCKAQ